MAEAIAPIENRSRFGGKRYRPAPEDRLFSNSVQKDLSGSSPVMSAGLVSIPQLRHGAIQNVIAIERSSHPAQHWKP